MIISPNTTLKAQGKLHKLHEGISHSALPSLMVLGAKNAFSNTKINNTFFFAWYHGYVIKQPYLPIFSRHCSTPLERGAVMACQRPHVGMQIDPFCRFQRPFCLWVHLNHYCMYQ